ncbi:MAG: thioredoxin fold domain-containing protein [Desulfobacterales bacterium]|nr:MAG: thioredoxin fold domain-containing protein [Desulfobacterales bacterium]
MSEIEISSKRDFETTIGKGVSLVDFNAPWCAPCRDQDSVIKQLDKSYSGKAVVAKVNIDENREIALKLGIQSIPTIILFRNGREIQRFVGLQPVETLFAALDNALA